MEIIIEVEGKGKARARLDGRNQGTAARLEKLLPIEGKANIWLDEIYFIIPLELEYENQSSNSNKGDISYWPPPGRLSVYSMENHNPLRQ